MIETLSELSPLTEALLWQGLTIFFRLSAMVSLLPAFGSQIIPTRIKLGVAISFTLIVAPAVAATPPSVTLDAIIWLSFTEITIGLLLGIGIRIFILMLQTAGSIAAQSTSLAQVLGGAMAEPVPAMSQIFVMASLALAVMTGLHVRLAELMILSYEILPMGRFLEGSDVASWGADQVRRAFSLSFTLAAPFVVLSVLYNLALGVINKAMPQLMVAFVGAPVITAGGLLILCLATPLIVSTWVEHLNNFIINPFAAVP
ncbi:MAG: flagellar biosynthetic protein FliR [Sulfitobacter sp.]